jgi:hypothetical protein
MNYGRTANVAQRTHRIRIWTAAIAAALLLVSLTVYGWDYYRLSAFERPFSPKHDMLKPSGSVAVKVGMLGVLLFCIIFLYALRKRVRWLQKIGTARHWLDFHIVAGTTAPLLIAFHASFKFRGIAGVAFWFMVSVAISGVVGRYVYAQIPRSLNSAEMSLDELHAAEQGLAEALSGQSLFTRQDLASLLSLPSSEEVRSLPAVRVLGVMLAYDIARPFRIAKLRALARKRSAALGSVSQELRENVERAVSLVKAKSSLSKRVAFLSRTQQIFHLWHVVHRPFSYSFAVLALLHIIVVFALGFV